MRSRPPTGKSEKVLGFVQPTTALEHSKPEPFSRAHDVSGWNRNAGIGEEDDLEGVVRRGDRAFESHLLQRGIRCKLLWLGLNVLPHRPDRVQSPGGVLQVREDEPEPRAGAGLHRAIVSIPNPIVCLTVATAIAALAVGRPAFATEILRCARFDQGELPVPAPSPYPSAIARADRISYAIKSAPYSVIFFGDSLTEGWDTGVWEHSLAPRGVLNAGVSGDRTDNLLWRLEYGNLAGPQPKAVVLLIGTNDLAYGRSPPRTAEGIRANLEVLRQHLPEARILLLGLLPREALPDAPLRIEVAQVNRLIRDCADDQHVFYAEIGDVLVTSGGLLSAEISPDQLHFTARGYALLAARLEPELDRLLSAEH